MNASARLLIACAFVWGCGRSNYRDEPDDVGVDAHVPTADAFVSPDAFTNPDAFMRPDAFASPDAFVIPDAFTNPDAFAGYPRPLRVCESTSLTGELGSFDPIGHIGTGPFTFETWLKTADTSVSVIVGYRDPGEVGLLFGMYGGSPFVQLRGVPNITVGRVVSDNVWHHVVVRRDTAGHLTALVDLTAASLDYTASLRDIDPVASRLVVGADSASPGSAPYTGQLRLVRIWNRELTDVELRAQAQTVLGPTTNLLFELALDETGTLVEESVRGTTTRISGSSTRTMDCISSL